MCAVVLGDDVLRDIEAMQAEVLALIKTLCAIPAPSHHEEQRAAFVSDWFKKRGIETQIDEAKNVRIPMGLDEHENVVVIMAHMDTVFSDMEPLLLREEDGKIYCPGVGDNTTNLAAMMMMADYVRRYSPRYGVLFVADSCEEGLGNLKGCRTIMDEYGSRVKAFLALDGGYAHICSQAVGSARYRITAKTCGGHSFSAFGNRNAIEVLARVACSIYEQRVSDLPAGKTTYNIGLICGGTSVNTIAQDAQMLYEYRSDNAVCLEMMEQSMRDILRSCSSEDAKVEADLLGLRPCGKLVDPQAQQALNTLCLTSIEQHSGKRPRLRAGSTDCNIPLSMGIPSACFGVYEGKGVHTREEWVDVASILSGMKAATQIILSWFDMK